MGGGGGSGGVGQWRRPLEMTLSMAGTGGLSLRPLPPPLILHSPILEPDLDLALGEVEIARQLLPTTLRQVLSGVEFLLQLHHLRVAIGVPRPLRHQRVQSDGIREGVGRGLMQRLSFPPSATFRVFLCPASRCR